MLWRAEAGGHLGASGSKVAEIAAIRGSGQVPGSKPPLALPNPIQAQALGNAARQPAVPVDSAPARPHCQHGMLSPAFPSPFQNPSPVPSPVPPQSLPSSLPHFKTPPQFSAPPQPPLPTPAPSSPPPPGPAPCPPHDPPQFPPQFPPRSYPRPPHTPLSPTAQSAHPPVTPWRTAPPASGRTQSPRCMSAAAGPGLGAVEGRWRRWLRRSRAGGGGCQGGRGQVEEVITAVEGRWRRWLRRLGVCVGTGRAGRAREDMLAPLTSKTTRVLPRRGRFRSQ